jgi:hypothetical protein
MLYTQPAQSIDEQLPVFVTENNRFTSVPSRQDVVNCIRVFNPRTPCHAKKQFYRAFVSRVFD